MYRSIEIQPPSRQLQDPATTQMPSHGTYVAVEIFDTTLRDGAQALAGENQFQQGEKVRIANTIASLGVGVIEAGMSEAAGDAEEIAEVAKTVGVTTYERHAWYQTENDGLSRAVFSRVPTIAVLTRAVPADIERAWQSVEGALNPRVHVFVPTDNNHIQAKFGERDTYQVMHMIREGVTQARRSRPPRGSIEFSPEIATTTQPSVLEQSIKTAVDAGVDVINVPDTVGQRDPFWMREFYTRVIGWAMSRNRYVTISAHNHNDNGMATANTLALVYAASDYTNRHNVPVHVQLETTICGLGERAGNADVFPVAAGLWKFTPEMGAPVQWYFNPINAVGVADAVMAAASMSVPLKSPIVGKETLVHRSGIHSDGIIKGGHRMYTPHDPTFWGHKSDAIHEDGRYQGKAGRDAVH